MPVIDWPLLRNGVVPTLPIDRRGQPPLKCCVASDNEASKTISCHSFFSPSVVYVAFNASWTLKCHIPAAKGLATCQRLRARAI